MTRRKLVGRCPQCGIEYEFEKNKKFCSLQCRFLSYVRLGENGCWDWSGIVGSHGYPQVGVNKTCYCGHRISAHLYLGLNLGSPSIVMHECDNRRCTNPAHLKIGTQAINMLDLYTRNRRPPRFAKEEITTIRKALAKGESVKSLSRRYICGEPTIAAIRDRSRRPYW